MITGALEQLRGDLVAEQEALDLVVATIGADQWQLATRSPGWSVADQIGHLTYFDRSAATAIVDPSQFHEDRGRSRRGRVERLTRRRARCADTVRSPRQTCSTRGARADALSTTRRPR